MYDDYGVQDKSQRNKDKTNNQHFKSHIENLGLFSGNNELEASHESMTIASFVDIFNLGIPYFLCNIT